MRRRLSRWWRPIDGSSSTYSTPVRPEPICVARRIRWASPPESDPAERASDRYVRPTSSRNSRRTRISRSTWAAILRLTGAQLQRLHEREGVAEAELGDVGDVAAVDEHCQHLGLEALALADDARDLAEVGGVALTLRVALGLGELALDVGHHALEAGGVLHLAAEAVAVAHRHLEVVALEHRLLHLGREVAPGRLQAEAEVAGEAFEQLLEVVVEALARVRPGQDDPLGQAELVVAEQQVGVDRHLRAEAGALGAGAERRVEREGARLDLGELQRVVVGARQLFGERAERAVALLVDEVDRHETVGETQRRLERVGQALQDVVGGHEAVDDHRDVVLDLLLEEGRARQLDLLAVDDGARVARRGELFEEVDEFALLLRDDRAQDLVARDRSPTPSAGRRSAERSASGSARRRRGSAATPMRAQSRRM